jgi:type VI secretion system protein ImpG
VRSTYYDEELDYIRNLAREFGATHHEASHLVEPGQDPDVERLLEGFAFLAAQVRQTLDDDFPELTQGLFNMLWPHFLRPVPSLAIEQFKPRPGGLRQTLKVPHGAQVVTEESSADVRFRYRTCWDVQLQPLELDAAAIETTRRGETSLVLQFALHPNVKFDSLDLGRMRLYLHEDVRHAWQLHGHLCRRVAEATATADAGDGPVPVRLEPVGFSRDEGVLPHRDGVPLGHRLLQEYFVFPQKFGFIDLLGLEALRGDQVKSRFTVRVVFDAEAEPGLKIVKEDIRLNCTPVINLFPHESQPITLEPTRARYPLRPQGSDTTRLDIWSVDGMSVRGTDRVDRDVPWFYSFSPDVFRESPAYFTVRRQVAPDGETFLTYATVVEASGGPHPIGEGTATFEITCTNGRGVAALEAGALRGTTDTSPTGATFENITKPTPQIEVPQRIGLLWRLLSLMSLNHLRLASADTLRLTLELMSSLNAGSGAGEKGFGLGGQDERSAREIQRRIRAIRTVDSKPVERIHGGGMIRGSRITVAVDPQPFEGLGALHLFGCVLDEFFASHATMNTFTQLEIRHDDSRLPLTWPPRLGRESV